MKIKEMDKFIKHCDLYFEQTDCTVLHPQNHRGFHLDTLLYKPNEKYPFWKLVTMGMSDYKMPAISQTLGSRNEYMMFVDADVDLTDRNVLSWYLGKLHLVAAFAYNNHTHITYGHSFEWKNDDPEDEMIAAFLELPQIVKNPAIVHCKLGWRKITVCLQVVLLNKDELGMLMAIGPMNFSDYLYPENGSVPHFLSQQHRNQKF